MWDAGKKMEVLTLRDALFQQAGGSNASCRVSSASLQGGAWCMHGRARAGSGRAARGRGLARRRPVWRPPWISVRPLLLVRPVFTTTWAQPSSPPSTQKLMTHELSSSSLPLSVYLCLSVPTPLVLACDAISRPSLQTPRDTASRQEGMFISPARPSGGAHLLDFLWILPCFSSLSRVLPADPKMRGRRATLARASLPSNRDAGRGCLLAGVWLIEAPAEEKRRRRGRVPAALVKQVIFLAGPAAEAWPCGPAGWNACRRAGHPDLSRVAKRPLTLVMTQEPQATRHQIARSIAGPASRRRLPTAGLMAGRSPRRRAAIKPGSVGKWDTPLHSLMWSSQRWLVRHWLTVRSAVVADGAYIPWKPVAKPVLVSVVFDLSPFW